MKFAILSLAAAAALTVSAGTASARPPGHYHGYGSYGYARPFVGSGYYGYPGYRYGSNYGSGFRLSFGGPRGIISIGTGGYYGYPGYYSYPSYAYPSYGWGYRPYYGGYGWRW